MSQEDSNDFIDVLISLIEKQDINLRRAISPKESLLSSLRVLTTGYSFIIELYN